MKHWFSFTVNMYCKWIICFWLYPGSNPDQNTDYSDTRISVVFPRWTQTYYNKIRHIHCLHSSIGSPIYKVLYVLKVGVACGTYEGEERCTRGLMGKPDGERLLGKHRHSWGIILKWILKNTGARVLDWSGLGLGYMVSRCGYGSELAVGNF